jgi:ComF family protein
MSVPPPLVRPRLPAVLHRLGRTVLDAVLPAQCLGCGALVGEPGSLCPACWAGITFIAPPFCAVCGLPFEVAAEPGALCGACLETVPPFARARAVMVYDDKSRGLVLAFKHGDRTDAAPPFGRWLARAGAELLAEADLVTPVPLHWTRLFVRRYNQAALLAQAAAAEAGRPYAPDLLRRHRRTPSLGRQGPAERRRTVAAAFAVPPSRAARVAGRRILLVDDVLTTGATAAACARALLKAGARAVDVLTLARVVRPLP